MDAKDEARLEIALELLDGLISDAKNWTPYQAEKLVKALQLRHTQAHDALVDARLLFGLEPQGTQ